MIVIALLFVLPFIGIFYQGWNLENWCYTLHNTKTYEAIKGSVYVALIATLINIVIGTPVGSVLSKEDSKWIIYLEILVFLPLIIPAFVTTMGIQYLFIKLGLIDTYLGVGIVHSIICFPYYIRAIKTGYKVINKGYEKMGRIMGASSITIFYKINLPMLMPAFIAGISICIIVSFAQYLITLIVGGGEVLTIPILMFPYISGGDIEIGGIYSIIYIFVNIILLLFLEKAIQGLFSKKEPKVEGNYDKN